MVQKSKLIFPEISWGIKEALFAVLVSIAGPIVASIGIGYALSSISSISDGYPLIELYVLLMSFMAQIIMLSSVWFLAFHKKKLSLNKLGIKKPDAHLFLRFVPAAVLLTLLVPVLYSIAISLLNMTYLQPASLPESIVSNRVSVLIFATMAVFVAPFVEEVFFRGFIYPAIANKYGVIVSAVLTSILFGLAHIVAANAIIAFFIGLILVYVYHQTTNLLAPILVHSAFNQISVIIIMVSL